MKRNRFLLLCIFIFLCLIFIWQLNWFKFNNSWEVATGWNIIPDDYKTSFYQPVDNQPSLFWLGHAGFLIEWEGQRLVLDPNLSESCSVSARTFPASINASNLGSIDAAIISHAHYDHFDFPTLNLIPRIRNMILPKNSQDFLPKNLLDNSVIHDLKVDQSVEIGKLKVTAVSAVHNGSRFHPFRSKYIALGYVISNGINSIYYSGDTAYSDQFKKIAHRFHPQVAILPIGAYQPKFILGKYHLSPEDAVQAGLDLQVQTVIPAHFGTFRLSLDYPETALPKFAFLAKEKNLNWKMPILAK